MLVGVVATMSLGLGCAENGDQSGTTEGINVTATTDPASATGAGAVDAGENAADSAGAGEAPDDAPTTTEPSDAETRGLGEPEVATELVITLGQPLDVAVRPGDDALWIVEQDGRIQRVVDGTATVAIDLSDRVSSGGEQGLLGLAFSPDGTLAYTNHTDFTGATVLSEFGVTSDHRLDVASERTLLTVDQPFANHNAGDLEFGPDGYLYVPLGDGGSGGDPLRHGSDPTTLLGALLRIDPAPDGDRPYSIPADNPFVDGTHDGIEGAPEVWAWGLRNPWKIAFDPVTDELWLPDVGQNDVEEVNVVAPSDGRPAGFAADFGWSAYEGTTRFNGDVPDRGDGLTMPVLTYDHDVGCSISGGVPYRGTAIPGLESAFLFSDFCAGTLWSFEPASGRSLTLLTGLDSVAAVRSGPDGEVYVIQRSGDVLRLVPA